MNLVSQKVLPGFVGINYLSPFPLRPVGLFQTASLLKILDDREIGNWGNREIQHNLLKNKPR